MEKVLDASGLAEKVREREREGERERERGPFFFFSPRARGATRGGEKHFFLSLNFLSSPPLAFLSSSSPLLYSLKLSDSTDGAPPEHPEDAGPHLQALLQRHPPRDRGDLRDDRRRLAQEDKHQAR